MSTISWLYDAIGARGETWNPIRARDRKTGRIGWFCVPVHAGCANCYAGGLNVLRGTGHAYAAQLLKRVELFLDEEVLLKPLSWARPRRIFPCSMTDLYAMWVKDAWLDKIKAVQAATARHDYVELTKRPERLRDYHNDPLTPARIGQQWNELRAAGHAVSAWSWPLPNVMAGPSCSEQPDADKFLPLAFAAPLARRVVSLEPLLALIDLAPWLASPRRLDQVIVGLESGNEARAREIALIEDVVAQCRAAGVPVFVKQLGAKPMFNGVRMRLRDRRKGEDPAQWPAHLRVREWVKPADETPIAGAAARPVQQELPL